MYLCRIFFVRRKGSRSSHVSAHTLVTPFYCVASALATCDFWGESYIFWAFSIFTWVTLGLLCNTFTRNQPAGWAVRVGPTTEHAWRQFSTACDEWRFCGERPECCALHASYCVRASLGLVESGRGYRRMPWGSFSTRAGYAASMVQVIKRSSDRQDQCTLLGCSLMHRVLYRIEDIFNDCLRRRLSSGLTDERFTKWLPLPCEKHLLKMQRSME